MWYFIDDRFHHCMIAYVWDQMYSIISLQDRF